MAKYLILSTDPSVRWKLTDDADLEDIGTKLFQALEHGRSEERIGYVLTIPVEIEGRQTAIHIRESDLSVAAVVDVPPQPPTVSDYGRDLGRR